MDKRTLVVGILIVALIVGGCIGKGKGEKPAKGITTTTTTIVTVMTTPITTSTSTTTVTSTSTTSTTIEILFKPITSCDDFCVTINYSHGFCRRNVMECRAMGEVPKREGNSYCFGVKTGDTCCCSKKGNSTIKNKTFHYF